MCKVISFYNSKGGIGKTSLTTNVATMLAKDGFEVLIIDMDSQSNIALSWGLKPFSNSFKSSYDLITGEIFTTSDIKEVAENLYIIASDRKLNNLDLEVYSNLSEYKNPMNLLNAALTPLKAEFDYILIDTPSALSLATLSSLIASNHVIIPFSPEPYAVSGLINLIHTLETINERKKNPTQILGIVKMLVDSRTNLHKEIIEQLMEYSKTFNINVFNQQISRSIQTPNSIAYDSQPITSTDRKDKANVEYYRLYKEIKGVFNHETGNQTTKQATDI